MPNTRELAVLYESAEPEGERTVGGGDGERLLGVYPSLRVLRRVLELWPSEWRPALGEEGEWSGWWNCVNRSEGDTDQVSADVDEDYAVDLAKFVASLVNAAPVMLEVAESVKTLQLEGWDFRSPTMDRVLAALRKVRP